MPRRILIALVLCVLASAPASAGTWRVGRVFTDCPGGCDFHDSTDVKNVVLGGGIDKAMKNLALAVGDTVLVFPRPGNGVDVACDDDNAFLVEFDMKPGVVVQAAEGPGTVCMNGAAGQEPAVFFVGTNETSVLDGFQIRWISTDKGLGGGVSCYAASGVVRNCIFQNCRAGSGAGVLQFLSDVRLENNLFVDNFCEDGGGVIALSTSSPVIVNNTLISSQAPPNTQGSALYTTDSAFEFDRNIVVNSSGASAIYCAGKNAGTITCSLFWNNPIGPFGGDCADTTGAAQNIHADPGFCDAATFDFTMCSNSPAVTGPCGVIGYAPPEGAVGCGSCPTFVHDLATESWGRIKSFYR